GQERDPDRGVRQGEARGGPAGPGGGDRVRPAAVPADPDDGVRLHPGRRATDEGERGGGRRPERHGHRGVLGDADRHRDGRVPDPPQLRLRRGAGAEARAGEAPARHRARGARPPPGRAARMKARALLAAAILLAGCTVGPDYKRPDVPVPPDFRGRAPGAPAGPESLGDVAWFQIFQDEALQGLIRTALEANYDLRIAAARVLDARAQVTITRSFQFPDVSGSASANYLHIEGDKTQFQVRDSFSPVATLDLAWEIDFWGRLRRATEAARADLLAAEDFRLFLGTAPGSRGATAVFQLPALCLPP